MRQRVARVHLRQLILVAVRRARCSLEYTFRTIYWAVFGLKDSRTVELGEGYQSRFTESLGYIVFGVYNWGAVIVLLNMLIAMMTRSFDKIAVSPHSNIGRMHLSTQPCFLGQLGLASLRGRLNEYQLRLGGSAGMSPLPGGR